MRTMLATAGGRRRRRSATAAAPPPGGGGGAVFTLSNQTAGNAVLAFERAQDGTLTPAGSDATGGTGTGCGARQPGRPGARRPRPLAVRGGTPAAASERLPAPAARTCTRPRTSPPAAPSRSASRARRHGVRPQRGRRGGTREHPGFKRSWNGRLTAIPGTNRPLSAAAPGAAQIEFSPRRLPPGGDRERGPTPSAPSGWTAGAARRRHVHAAAARPRSASPSTAAARSVVSDAGAGAPARQRPVLLPPGKGGTLRTVTGFAATTQTAACWVVITRHGVASPPTQGSNPRVVVRRRPRRRADAEIAVAAHLGRPDRRRPQPGRRVPVRPNAGADDVTAFAVGDDGALTVVETETGRPGRCDGAGRALITVAGLGDIRV